MSVIIVLIVKKYYIGLKDDPTTNFDKLVELDKKLRDNFTQLQEQAWDNGVDV